jgi:hypothetical protein
MLLAALLWKNLLEQQPLLQNPLVITVDSIRLPISASTAWSISGVLVLAGQIVVVIGLLLSGRQATRAIREIRRT